MKKTLTLPNKKKLTYTPTPLPKKKSTGKKYV
jgi:hypothetical protein